MGSKNIELDLGETQKNMQFYTVFALKSVYAIILHRLQLIVSEKKTVLQITAGRMHLFLCRVKKGRK